MASDIERFVKRTTTASGVPMVPQDPGALARVAALVSGAGSPAPARVLTDRQAA